MSLLVWIVLGFVSGWVASIIMKTSRQQGPVMDIVLGIAGAIAGGLAMSFIGQPGISGLNLYSFIVATIGSALLIWLGRVFTRTYN